MRHDSMIANIAIIDPMLTISCPKDVTAHVGLDTLCQVSLSLNWIIESLNEWVLVFQWIIDLVRW